MNHYELIPNELGSLDQWVGANKGSKVPLDIVTTRHASSTDPSTWCDFKTAYEMYDRGLYDYLGFVFNDNGIVGIDIDEGYEEGLITKLACDVIERCKSYTEKSRSGRGFHILVKGDIPFSGRNNRNGVEIYKSSRFFIMTGNVFMYDTVVENQEAINYIIDTYFALPQGSMVASQGNKAYQPKIYQPIWEIKDGKIPLKPTYPPIGEGSRNICLTSLAGSLHAQGMDAERIYSELLECNSQACTPPLDEDEVRAIVNSVTRYSRSVR